MSILQSPSADCIGTADDRRMTPYPKRLIEVDLPIARISAHARREKSIRHGHISTLHIWWARRPLAACRAVILASLWPDPVDLAEWAKEADAKGEVRAPKGHTLKPDEGVVIRPSRFLDEARQRIIKWAQIGLHKASSDSYKLMVQVQKNPTLLDDPSKLRDGLLDFIADFADWDNATDRDYLDIARALVVAAHESVGGSITEKSVVLDPFAGGGAMPLEALRLGTNAIASDLNPVAVLLNRATQELIPSAKEEFGAGVRVLGKEIAKRALARMPNVFPTDPDGGVPTAYLWARTIKCEGPGCGSTVPIVRNPLLASRGKESIWIHFGVDASSKRTAPVVKSGIPRTQDLSGTVRRSSVTCPCCGYTTPPRSVQAQLKLRMGGADDSELLAVVIESQGTGRRTYRTPTAADHQAYLLAEKELERREANGETIRRPSDVLPLMSGVFNVPIYGHTTWGSLFNFRQGLVLTTIAEVIRDMSAIEIERYCGVSARIGRTLMALALDRQADYDSSICTWVQSGEFVGHTFAQGQSLPIKFDYAEVSPFASGSGNWEGAVDWVARVVEWCRRGGYEPGTVMRASATQLPLPDDSVDLVATDPPYYNAVPYADLSDFFYVWLRETLGKEMPDLFSDRLVAKDSEICEMSGWDPDRYPHKDAKFFENGMQDALAESRRVLRDAGIAVVVFAHKSTSGWEALLQAVISAGWVVTASWPIDTEMGARLRARNSAALGSSVHLVCRPRDASIREGGRQDVGEWREVLGQLPKRIEEWLPRLQAEGVVGADAIFACLGPALEIFSRFDRVEKASGEAVSLREYLEHVWASVSSEALSMIFKDADAAGLEPDARLTAMWLWTIGGGKPQASDDGEAHEEIEDDDNGSGKKPKVSGFVLEFDAARKIAQGLGIHLEKSESIVEVKGETARLLPVSERTRYLFGKGTEEDNAKARKTKKKAKQGSLFEELDAIEAEVSSTGSRFGGIQGTQPGATVLDKVHQSMILFAAGRGEALKRFLVEDGVGKEGRFWKLAQSLSALYPSGTDEKRWVDGVLARKKGLGF